jgi:hypothetical protein
VTVIAAMVESDTSLLLAADSGETEMPGQLRSVFLGKLRRHPSAPLAWAATGDVQLGKDFTMWLEKYEWPAPSWDVFRDQAAEQLARINGRRRALAKLAGVELSENDCASVLIAGWIDTPQIVRS